MHRVERNPEGKWIRSTIIDNIGKIAYDGVVLKLEVAKLTNPFDVIGLIEKASDYHICLYKDYTIAISDEKWSKYFVPIETKSEE